MPSGNGFSVIQVEADNRQRLWQFSFGVRAGSALQSSVVLPELKPIGYHAWIDADTVPGFPEGAEDGNYLAQTPPYRAAKGPVTTVSELMALPGIRGDVDRVASARGMAI